MIKVIKIRLGAPSGMIEGDPHERRDCMTVAQRLHGRIPYYDGMQHRLIPVRVLVPHRRENLVQMIDVGVADEGAQNAITVILFEAVLDVVGVEIEVGLGRRDAQDQRHLDKRVARTLHVQTWIGIVLVHGQSRSDARHESVKASPGILHHVATINRYNK